MAISLKYGNIEISGIPSNEPVFVLRAQDKVAGLAIQDYRDRCKVFKCSEEYVDSITKVLDSIVKWRATHSVKIPN